MVSAAKLAWRKNPRTSAPRVKTGCRTCRVRRIKCDEGKPECVKCLSTGRKCDGYDSTQPTTSSEPKNFLSADLVPTSPPIVIFTNARFIEPSPIRQHATHAFGFLQALGSSQLPGYFNSDLWGRYILFLAREDESVFCAATALGSLHAWYATGMVSSLAKVEIFAFRQYNKAIRLLTDRSNPPNDAIVLVTCYIFSCFEALYGNYAAAFDHISSGIRLAVANMNAPQRHSASGKQFWGLHTFQGSILRHFARLELITGLANPEWALQTTGLGFKDLPFSDFSSVEEARDALDSLVLAVLSCERDDLPNPKLRESSTNVDRARLHNSVLLWQDKLDSSFRLERCDPETARQIKVLKINCAGILVKLLVTAKCREMVYDNFLPYFKLIADFAQDVIPKSGNWSCSEREYSVDMGIIPVLYYTGTKCRDPIIRRKAQTLLVTSHRKEWMWESLAAAKVVELVISIEEKGLDVSICTDVPENVRLGEIWVHLLPTPDRRASVSFTRQSEPLSGTRSSIEIIEEIISW